MFGSALKSIFNNNSKKLLLLAIPSATYFYSKCSKKTATLATSTSEEKNVKIEAGKVVKTMLTQEISQPLNNISDDSANDNQNFVDVKSKIEKEEEIFKDPLWMSRAKLKIKGDNVLVFSGNSNINLAKEIAERLGMNPGESVLGRFADGEINVSINTNIRGKNVYIIQSTCPPVNENLIELFLLTTSLRRSSAGKITAVIPYYGYARSDRLNARVPVAAADVAKILETLGVDRVISVDLHSGQLQGFFSNKVPVDNLSSHIILVDYLLKSDLIKDYNNLSIVSPDPGAVYRTKEFADLLALKTGVEQIGVTMLMKHSLDRHNESKLELVGNVEGKNCIILDDIIDTAATLCDSAEVLRKKGANRILCFATHGLFSGNALAQINQSQIEKVFITNTVPFKRHLESNKIEVISIGTLLAEVIRVIESNQSLTQQILYAYMQTKFSGIDKGVKTQNPNLSTPTGIRKLL